MSGYAARWNCARQRAGTPGCRTSLDRDRLEPLAGEDLHLGEALDDEVERLGPLGRRSEQIRDAVRQLDSGKRSRADAIAVGDT